ncbi:MAG: serine/threonine protein phosphatase, partial [Planctomycetes bacterium]|nr:serine/threonine protein phosphatase [Planctomycetota bacterium]
MSVDTALAADTFFIDIDHAAQRKWNQNVCGDAYVSRRLENEGRLIAVLADGLGSGIKANILASMTAQMALRFVAAGSDLLRFSEVMM